LSSLKWCRAQYTKSVIARKASIGFSLIAIQADASLHSAQHIAGELNVICDKLSRNCNFKHETLHEKNRVSEVKQEKIVQLLNICDPTASVNSSEQHLQLLQNFLELLMC
jgi:hypothetical protein